MRLQYRVLGDPKPQGSKRHVGNGVMVESAGAALKTWREDVKHASIDALLDHFNTAGVPPVSMHGPVELAIVFSLRRPASHHRAANRERELRDDAPMYHAQRPDIDKLQRSTLDALTSAGVIGDDCQIATVTATKTWCDIEEPPGAYITISELVDPTTFESTKTGARR